MKLLQAYSAFLALFEVPSIVKLITGAALSTASPWFQNGLNDTPEAAALYSAFLTLLCVARLAVVVYPRNKALLLNSATVHAIEIPLFFYLMRRLPDVGPERLFIMAFVLVNPFIYLSSALKQK